MSELAANPGIRAVVRKLYKDMAVVSTEPTETGEIELDPFHVHGAVKRIVRKPIKLIELTDQFLHMITAEKKKLIKVCKLLFLTSTLNVSSYFCCFTHRKSMLI